MPTASRTVPKTELLSATHPAKSLNPQIPFGSPPCFPSSRVADTRPSSEHACFIRGALKSYGADPISTEHSIFDSKYAAR